MARRHRPVGCAGGYSRVPARNETTVNARHCPHSFRHHAADAGLARPRSAAAGHGRPRESVQRTRGLRRPGRSRDARSDRCRPLVRPRTAGHRASGVGLPALRPRQPRAFREFAAALGAPPVAGRKGRKATARHHGQRADPARADALSRARERAGTEAGHHDRPRESRRAVATAGLQPDRHRHRQRRIRSPRVDLRHLPLGAGGGAAARLLRRRAGKPAPVRSRHPAHHRGNRRPPAASRQRSPARRREHQTLPRPLSRNVRRQRHAGSALPGSQRRPPARRHGTLAAAARRQAGDDLRPSRR